MPNYEFKTGPDWFSIKFNQTGNKIEIKLDKEKGFLIHNESLCIFPFFFYFDLCKHISQTIIKNWRPKNKTKLKPRQYYPFIFKQSRYTYPFIYREWKRLGNKLSDTIYNLQKNFYKASPKSKTIAICSRITYIWDDKYLISDLSRFPAAVFCLDYWLKNGNSFSNMSLFNWKAIPSSVGTYRALNKTLTEWPNRLDSSIITRLKTQKLVRPYNKRSELLLTSLAGEHSYLGVFSPHAKIIQYAKDKEIKKAAKICEIKLNKIAGYFNLHSYLRDYTIRHGGDIVSLARKSKKWHAEQTYNRARYNCEYSPETKTQTPPIDLPKSPHITFLSTVEDLIAESAEMDHCIRSYAKRAITGESFLFHVEKDGEKCSAEVSPQGAVVQVQGPRNQENQTCKWAYKTLSKWGRKIVLSNSASLEGTDYDLPF